VTLLGVTAVPLTTTENALAAAVVAESASLNVSVTSVPAEFVVANESVGPTESALFVTDVADNEAASLPAESCTAFASLPAVGSVYATVTDSPEVTAGEANVNTTVEPDTATPLTERDTPPTDTANADVDAVVPDNASEYVRVTVVPAAFTAAETNAGAVASTVESFVTEVADNEAASLPAESCTANESFPEVGSVYATVTAWPLWTAGDASVSSMTLVLDLVTLLTERETPSTVTANAPATAVVVNSVSEYVNVTFVPAVFTADD
jgi:hypothetical protein